MTEIAVFPRECLTQEVPFLYWRQAVEIVQCATERASWLPRKRAERAPDWVQPIPSALVRNQDGNYLVQKRVRNTRSDLRSRISLMVGGHVDRTPGFYTLEELMVMTLRRELQEEIGVSEVLSLEGIGLVVDWASLAASRHVGFVYEVVVDSPVESLAGSEFQLTSALSGAFVSAFALSNLMPRLDPWTRTVVECYVGRDGSAESHMTDAREMFAFEPAPTLSSKTRTQRMEASARRSKKVGEADLSGWQSAHRARPKAT